MHQVQRVYFQENNFFFPRVKKGMLSIFTMLDCLDRSVKAARVAQNTPHDRETIMKVLAGPTCPSHD